jgi:hypothetical protein
MAQRGDNILRLWSLHDLNNPVRQYIGHTDIMTAFDWRIIEVNGVKEYQLVTWSKDQNLKLWYVDRAIQEVGIFYEISRVEDHVFRCAKIKMHLPFLRN